MRSLIKKAQSSGITNAEVRKIARLIESLEMFRVVVKNINVEVVLDTSTEETPGLGNAAVLSSKDYNVLTPSHLGVCADTYNDLLAVADKHPTKSVWDPISSEFLHVRRG
jgi:hypothetical protein